MLLLICDVDGAGLVQIAGVSSGPTEGAAARETGEDERLSSAEERDAGAETTAGGEPAGEPETETR